MCALFQAAYNLFCSMTDWLRSLGSAPNNCYLTDQHKHLATV